MNKDFLQAREELTQLLEQNGLDLFLVFVSRFKISHYMYKDDTGVRIHFDYGDTEDYTRAFISIRNGFTRFIMTESSVEPTLRAFKRFINLKAFI